jgi:hypothetical protein
VSRGATLPVFALRRRAARGLGSSRGNPIARYSWSPGPASRTISKGTNGRALRLSGRASRIGTRRRGRCVRGGGDSETFPQQHLYPPVSGNKAGFSLASRGVCPAPGRPGRHLNSMAAPRPRRASDWSKRERDATRSGGAPSAGSLIEQSDREPPPLRARCDQAAVLLGTRPKATFLSMVATRVR